MAFCTRRIFCRDLGLLGIVGITGCRSRKAPPAPSPGAATFVVGTAVFRSLSPRAMTTLAAVCERLLPRDQDPGAIDLGVPAYIDQALASPELAHLRDPLRKRVLPAFDEKAGARHGGKAFHELGAEEQDAILFEMQQSNDRAFDVLMTLTLEGAFSDPKYGGNVGGRGFAMIGFAPHPPMKKMVPTPAPPTSSSPSSAHDQHAPD